MPATLPPWLQASDAPATYARLMPEGFKLGAQSDQFAQEMALKRGQREDEMLRAGATLGMQAGSQANAMAMNVANLRQQQREQAQKMQLAWQSEANQLAAQAASLNEAAYRTDLEHTIRQQQLQRQMLEDSQRLAIEDEYKKGLIAINKDKLAEQSRQFQWKTQEAAKKTAAIMRFQAELAQAGDDPKKQLAVIQRNALALGSTPTALVNSFTKTTAPQRAQVVKASDGSNLQLMPDGTWKQITGPKEETETVTETIPATEAVEGSPEIQAQKKELFGFDVLAKDQPYVPATLPVPARGAQRITRKVPVRKASSATPFKEGQFIRNKKDGKLYRVVNGKPVLIE